MALDGPSRRIIVQPQEQPAVTPQPGEAPVPTTPVEPEKVPA